MYKKMMFNYSALEDTVVNIARKASLLISVLTFFTFIYLLIITIQLILAPPEEQLQSADPVNIVWPDSEDYLLDMYEEFSFGTTMPHSDSDIKAIKDKLILSEQDSDIPILIVTFLIKHPNFNIDTADLQQIQDKVDEYGEWMTSMMEEYDDIDHYHAGLLQWVTDFTSDPIFYDFAYSLPLYGEELEFGEVEEAVDDAIIAYSQQYDSALSIDYEEQEFFQMELSEYQKNIEIRVMQTCITLGIFGFFLLLILLFRIEQSLKPQD
ncbi:MAG: hypothetical protein DRQ48_12020 [Gammaproteobacteria bacterium]|nr:MAG: hypothetical protein DRQ48_12020 [Gammaproteobacteria bacterium]